METKEIHISDYNYELADERIAKYPMAERDHSKLLIYHHGEVGEDMFYNLPKHLPAKALMVFNNTKVIQARLHFRKDTGALIEVFLLEPAEPADYEQMFQMRERCSWLCLIGNQKKWKEGTLTRELEVSGKKLVLKATRKGEHGTSQWIDFEWDGDVPFADIIDVVRISTVRHRRVTRRLTRLSTRKSRGVSPLLQQDCTSQSMSLPTLMPMVLSGRN